jgi:NTP pyrophosphatase (non-canonical NTP hydrolase)
MASDKDTNIQILKDLLIDFRDKRDWEQFHDPKNIAEAISIEAGELQELFLWKDKETISKEIENKPEFKERVEEELADIFIFCLNFANSTNLDITTIVKDKIEKTDKKYPAEKARGNAKKYTEL